MNATASKRLFGDLQKANQAARAGRRAEASLIYDEVLRQAADDVPLHIEMGNLCSNMEQFDKAIEHYSVAVGQQPENAQFLGLLGVA
ncbi:MAG: tetratricopeptide repeat protein, partial [Woeseiaceae bacterium]